MSEEWPSMKRVKCGCGGNGVLNTGHIIAATGEYLANVKCDKCGIATRVCVNMDMAEAAVEAVESWNTAMGAENICENCKEYIFDETCEGWCRCDDEYPTPRKYGCNCFERKGESWLTN